MRKKLNIEFYIQQMFQDKRVFVYSIATSHVVESLFIEKLKNVVDSQNKGSVHDLINSSLFATSTYDRSITAKKFVESNKISYFPVSSISFGPNGNLHPLPLEITEDQIPSDHTVFANFNFKEGEIKNKVIFGNNEVQLITKTFNVTFNLIDNNFVLLKKHTTMLKDSDIIDGQTVFAWFKSSAESPNYNILMSQKFIWMTCPKYKVKFERQGKDFVFSKGEMR